MVAHLAMYTIARHEGAPEALGQFRLLRWLVDHCSLGAALASQLLKEYLHGELEWKPYIVQPVPLEKLLSTS